MEAFFIKLLSVIFNESISPLNHSSKKPSFLILPA